MIVEFVIDVLRHIDVFALEKNIIISIKIKAPIYFLTNADYAVFFNVLCRVLLQQ